MELEGRQRTWDVNMVWKYERREGNFLDDYITTSETAQTITTGVKTKPTDKNFIQTLILILCCLTL